MQLSSQYGFFIDAIRTLANGQERQWPGARVDDEKLRLELT